MRAVIARGPGGPEVLEVVERPQPQPGPGELLLRVRAAALNHADSSQRQGLYPLPKDASDVLGLDVAGTVVATGSGVDETMEGRRVCALIAGGGYADYALVPASLAIPIPDGIDDTSAAAIPEVFTTAFENLFNRGRLQPGEDVLIHGGSSGVGTAAIQLARQRGCRVMATARNREKLATCADLGATVLINYATEDFVTAVMAATDGRGVDVVLDIVGGPYLARNLEALAVEGRIALVGIVGGPHAEIDLMPVLFKRATITGSTIRSRSTEEKAALVRQVEQEVMPDIASGAIRPVIGAVLPFEEVVRAHELLDSSEHIGKIVLTL